MSGAPSGVSRLGRATPTFLQTVLLAIHLLPMLMLVFTADKNITEIVAELIPTAANKVGANFSPLPDFVSNVHQWIESLRMGAFSMGWAEDYVWQQPMATPQMGLLRVDMIRSGLRKIPPAKRNHLYYIMPQ